MKHFFIPILTLFLFYSISAHSKYVEQEITIENASEQVINGLRVRSTFNEEKDSINQKVYISPGTKKTYPIKLWDGGQIEVRVHYRFGKDDKMSKTYSQDTPKSQTISPLVLTFAGGSQGHWGH